MKKLSVLVGVLVIIVVALCAHFMSIEKRIPLMLKEQSGVNLTVGHAKLRPGPVLILEDVRIPNPAGYPVGDALTIKSVIIALDELRGESMTVQAVTATGIVGNLAFNGTIDNFAALQALMDQSYHEPPKGDYWAKPTVIQTLQVRQVSLVSGTTNAVLPDRNSQPIGSSQAPVPLKKAYMLAIAKVLENERQGIAPAAVEKVTGQVHQLIDEGAAGVKSFIDAVTSKMNGTVGAPIAEPPKPLPLPPQGGPPQPLLHPEDAVQDKMTKDNEKVQGPPPVPPVGQPSAATPAVPAQPSPSPSATQPAPNAVVVPPASNTKVP